MFRSSFVLVVALFSSQAMAVYKCTDVDGKVAFQDAPCSGKGSAIDVKPASGSSTSSAVGGGEAQARLEKMKYDNAISEAIRARTPLVGMTTAQLQEAMGPATRVNADTYRSEQREQVIYERPNQTWYVYTRNGFVESIQNQAAVHGTRQKKAVSCPTQHEINSAITSASSISLSVEEKTARWNAIKEMQSCGK